MRLFQGWIHHTPYNKTVHYSKKNEVVFGTEDIINNISKYWNTMKPVYTDPA